MKLLNNNYYYLMSYRILQEKKEKAKYSTVQRSRPLPPRDYFLILLDLIPAKGTLAADYPNRKKS